MRRYMIYTLTILIITLFSCSGPPAGTYSPLYKYEEYSITKVKDIDVNNLYDTNYYNQYLNYLDSHQGIISNNDYVTLMNDVVVRVSNGNYTELYHLTNQGNAEFLDANLSFIALLDGSLLYVIDRDGNTNYSETVTNSLFICALGKGYSSLVAYGNLLPSEYEGWADEYFNKHSLVIIDLSNKQKKYLPEAYSIIGFSKDNRYLIYNYYTGRRYKQAYLDSSVLRGTWIYPGTGCPSFYDTSNNQNYVIGNYNFESQYSLEEWTDVTLGFSEDLTAVFVLQMRTASYGIPSPLYDGRSVEEVCGIWRVDISQHGFSD